MRVSAPNDSGTAVATSTGVICAAWWRMDFRNAGHWRETFMFLMRGLFASRGRRRDFSPDESGTRIRFTGDGTVWAESPDFSIGT